MMLYIGLTIAFSVMVLTDLIGNSMVILVVLLNKSMRTPMSQLILNLALADIVVALFISIQFIVGPMYQHTGGVAGSFLCKFITGGTMAWTAAVASLCNLVAISAERYNAIVQPLSSLTNLTTNKLKIIMPGCWLTGFLWNTPLFLTVTYREDLGTCGEKWPNTILPKLYSFGWSMVAGVIPITVMSCLYYQVVRKLWFKRSTGILSNSAKMVLQSRRKATLSVITVSVIYVICWTPALVMYILAYMLPNHRVHSVTHQITIFLATFNSSVNPIVYSFSSARFRKHLMGLLKCNRSLGRPGNGLLGVVSSRSFPQNSSDRTSRNSSKVNKGFRLDEGRTTQGATGGPTQAGGTAVLKFEDTRL